jgi:hypothetical protein
MLYCKFTNLSLEYKVLVTSYFSEVPLSHYQTHLMSIISKLHNEGWDNGQISRFLCEKGYLSVRGKQILSNHVWSMLMKHSVRLERNSQKPRVSLVSVSVKTDKTK